MFTLDAAVVFPVRFPVPTCLTYRAHKLLAASGTINNTTSPVHRAYLHLNFITVPLISVLLLLASGAIDGQVVSDGVVGANGVQPLDIMALFISLVSRTKVGMLLWLLLMQDVAQAYLSISLDATGLLRFLAFWVVRKGGHSGRKLFSYLYAFFLICGVVVGNVREPLYSSAHLKGV